MIGFIAYMVVISKLALYLNHYSNSIIHYKIIEQ